MPLCCENKMIRRRRQLQRRRRRHANNRQLQQPMTMIEKVGGGGKSGNLVEATVEGAIGTEIGGEVGVVTETESTEESVVGAAAGNVIGTEIGILVVTTDTPSAAGARVDTGTETATGTERGGEDGLAAEMVAGKSARELGARGRMVGLTLATVEVGQRTLSPWKQRTSCVHSWVCRRLSKLSRCSALLHGYGIAPALFCKLHMTQGRKTEDTSYPEYRENKLGI